MRRLGLALLTLGIAVLPPSAAAEGEPQTVEQWVAAVEGTYEGVDTLSADFVQVTRSTAMGSESKQKGSVILKKPRKMRWEFSGTDAKLFLTDGERMSIYSPADKQVIVYDDLSGAGTGMEGLLTDLNQIDTHFNVAEVDTKRSNKTVGFELTPKSEGVSFKTLRLTVQRKNYVVEQVVIVDGFDNETEITFSSVKLNPGAEDATFTFDPPPGVEVIKPDEGA